MRVIKLLIFAGFVILFLGLFVLQAWFNITKSDFSLQPLVYWLVFVVWIMVLLNFRLSSSWTLAAAFVLFLLAAALSTLGHAGTGEATMKISFIGWIIGIIQALIEYKKGHV